MVQQNVLFILLTSLLHSKYLSERESSYGFALVKGRLSNTKQESFLKSTSAATVC